MIQVDVISLTNLLAISGLAASLAILFNYRKGRKKTPFPPGPKGLPLIGNAADLPKSTPWITFSQWGEIYGGMVYISAFGKSVLIVNDAAIASELLDKKGKLYSDRPTFALAGDMIGWNEILGLTQFDNNGPFSESRRQMAQYMGSRGKVMDSFSDGLHKGVHNFLKRLLDNPKDWALHIRMYSASTVLRLSYGYELEREDDELLVLVEKAMDDFSDLTLSGKYLVDVIPVLRYIPAWFPGAGWKRKIPEYAAVFHRMLDAPYEWAEKQFNSGNEKAGFVQDSLSKNDNLNSHQKHLIKLIASAMYGGGTDTTLAGIKSFFIAMVLFPAAQAKAQAEIDAVVGSGRLPTLEDRPNLPYTEAFYWEVLRFYTFVPLSIPHAVREDDVHNGYFIPKGTTVIPNVWQFMHNPIKYRDPEQFLPERFLSVDENSPEEDPRNYVFGFGRRICPGRHLGDASMWIAMTSVMTAFSIRPAVKNGKRIVPNPKLHEGTIVQHESFECEIKVRSDVFENLIRYS